MESKKIWQQELTFGTYLFLVFFNAFFFWYTDYLSLKIICCIATFIFLLLAISIRKIKIDDPKVTYEVIPIEGREDIIAVKMIIIPEFPMRFPEVLEVKGKRYNFSHPTKSPLLDGAYYRRDNADEC